MDIMTWVNKFAKQFNLKFTPRNEHEEVYYNFNKVNREFLNDHKDRVGNGTIFHQESLTIITDVNKQNIIDIEFSDSIHISDCARKIELEFHGGYGVYDTDKPKSIISSNERIKKNAIRLATKARKIAKIFSDLADKYEYIATHIEEVDGVEK